MASENKKNKAKNSYFHNGAEKVTSKWKRVYYFNKKQRNINKRIEMEELTQEGSTLLVCRNIFNSFCQEFNIKGTFKVHKEKNNIIYCLCETELIDKSRFKNCELKAFSYFPFFIYTDNPELAIKILVTECNIILNKYGIQGECKI